MRSVKTVCVGTERHLHRCKIKSNDIALIRETNEVTKVLSRTYGMTGVVIRYFGK